MKIISGKGGEFYEATFRRHDGLLDALRLAGDRWYACHADTACSGYEWRRVYDAALVEELEAAYCETQDGTMVKP